MIYSAKPETPGDSTSTYLSKDPMHTLKIWILKLKFSFQV